MLLIIPKNLNLNAIHKESLLSNPDSVGFFFSPWWTAVLFHYTLILSLIFVIWKQFDEYSWCVKMKSVSVMNDFINKYWRGEKIGKNFVWSWQHSKYLWNYCSVLSFCFDYCNSSLFQTVYESVRVQCLATISASLKFDSRWMVQKYLQFTKTISCIHFS
jgi:hypothetical protein